MVAAVTKQLNKNRSMDKKVTLAQLKEVVQEAYDQVKTNTGARMPTIFLTWQMSIKISSELVSACQRADYPCGRY